MYTDPSSPRFSQETQAMFTEHLLCPQAQHEQTQYQQSKQHKQSKQHSADGTSEYQTKTCVRDQFITLQNCIEQHILGQQHLVERIIMALLADGHLLVEGIPGLAKTQRIF